MFYVAFPTFFGKRAARDGQWGQITDACKAERRVAEHRGRYNTTGRCPDCTMKGRGSHRLPWPGITTSRGQNLLVLPSTHENTGRYTFVNYLVLAKICHGGGSQPSKRVHRPNKLAEPSFLVLRRGRSQHGVK